jgi:hypothetical protein
MTQTLGFRILVIVICLIFVFWDLGFGIFSSPNLQISWS